MPLVDLSMVEQRHDAVREVLDGASVKDTATRYGVDREPFTLAPVSCQRQTRMIQPKPGRRRRDDYKRWGQSPNP